MEIAITREEQEGGVNVLVKVRLSGRETSRLFVTGDTLIHLPHEGAVADGAAPIPRASIFLSELAADGFARTFRDASAAERFAAAVRTQLDTALEAP